MEYGQPAAEWTIRFGIDGGEQRGTAGGLTAGLPCAVTVFRRGRVVLQLYAPGSRGLRVLPPDPAGNRARATALGLGATWAIKMTELIAGLLRISIEEGMNAEWVIDTLLERPDVCPGNSQPACVELRVLGGPLLAGFLGLPCL